jgi:hypothetical protein
LFQLLLFVVILLAVYGLNQVTQHWHYVVPTTSGKVILAAGFDGFQDDWSQYTGKLKAQIMDTGVLRLNVSDFNSLPFSVANPYIQNFDLRVQAKPIKGPSNNGYGVIFRLQDKDNAAPGDDDYFLFLVSSDGYYQIMRQLNGKQKVISDWIPSPAVQQGLNVTNTLRVIANGNQFQFYVNGQQVQLCVPDDASGQSTYDEAKAECVKGKMLDILADDSIAYGRIGVAAQSFDTLVDDTMPGGADGQDQPAIVVDFDNVVVLGPG